MSFEVRRVRPNEWDAAGEVTALAYAEFGPKTSANTQVRETESWDGYFAALRDVRGRDAVAPVYVAVDADTGAILGSLTLETSARVNPEARPLDHDESYIRMLGVDPGARGRGVGKALMEHAIAMSKAEGCTRITLNTTLKMDAARAIYESMGFVQVAEEEFDDGFKLLTYALSI